MKKLLTLILVFSFTISYAQKETFDLTTFAPPLKEKDWIKDVKENLISYAITDNKKKTWCQIGIYKSTISKGSIDKDFESDWQELVARPYQISEAPQTNDVQESDGWKIKAGTGKFIFNSKDAMTMLTTASGYTRCVSILVVTNSQDYTPQIQSFIKSVSLIKPDTIQQEPPVTKNNTSVVVGSWGKSNAVSQLYNRSGSYSYNKQQYYFSANGTYIFLGKIYSEQNNETLLIKESGAYLINGNNITINPKSSVIEAWSKSNGADNYNKLKSSQKRALEKITYQFTIIEKNLVLQTTIETVRDGRFSNGNTYSYGPPSTFTVIKLPGK